MKKLLLILTVFLSLTSVQGQTNIYHPFPDSNSCWNINYDVAMCNFGSAYENYSITISGDTTINSQLYHKLIIPYVQFYTSGTCTQQNTVGYKGAIRQDTLVKRVFFVPPTNNTEQLIYDFTLHIGDTVKGYLESWAYQPDVVISIDSVLVGNNYHKRWKINSCYNIYLIEGVGSTYGLLTLSPGCVTDQADVSITCFQQNGQTLYPDTTSNCQLITSINSIDPISNQVKVFPNPSNGSFTVDFNGTPIKEIRLTDLLGNIILQQQINNKLMFTLDNLQSGIYILTIIDNENKSIKKEIISCP